MRRAVAGLLALAVSASAAAEVTLESARADFEAMRTVDAQRQFSQLLAQHPDDPGLLYYLGRLQLRQYHRRDAVELLRRAVALRPTNTRYQLDLCEAIGAYIDEQPFYKKLGLAQEIHQHLLVALANDPRSVAVHDGLMKFYIEAPAVIGGGVDKAQQEAEQIAALDASRGHVAFAVIATHQRRYADAERELRAAVQAAPDDPLPRYALGQAQVAQQHFDAALSTYSEILKRFPRETAAYYQIAAVAMTSGHQLGRGLDAAKTYVARGPLIDDDPSPLQAYRLLGRLLEKCDEPAKARDAYRTALQLDPTDDAAAQALQKLD